METRMFSLCSLSTGLPRCLTSFFTHQGPSQCLRVQEMLDTIGMSQVSQCSLVVHLLLSMRFPSAEETLVLLSFLPQVGTLCTHRSPPVSLGLLHFLRSKNLNWWLLCTASVVCSCYVVSCYTCSVGKIFNSLRRVLCFSFSTSSWTAQFFPDSLKFGCCAQRAAISF